MEDYYGKLIPVAAEDEGLACQQARDYMAEIQREMGRLQEQLRHVASMYEYLSRKLNLAEPTEITNIAFSPASVGTPVGRHQVIMQTALDLVRSGTPSLSPQRVMEELNQKQVDLGVQQPHAVIGTVLGRSEGFRRVAENKFEYVGRREAW